MVVLVYKLWLTSTIHNSNLTTHCFNHFRFWQVGCCAPINPGLHSESISGWSTLGLFSSRYAPGQTTVDVVSDLRIRACTCHMWVDCEVPYSGQYWIVCHQLLPGSWMFKCQCHRACQLVCLHQGC